MRSAHNRGNVLYKLVNVHR